MIALYVALYATAIVLVAVGLLAPAIVLAVLAKTIAFRRELMRFVTPIKPVILKG